MNIVLQQYNSSCYNVWEDVCLNSKAEYTDGLAGVYRVHKYHKKYTIENDITVAGVTKIYI